MYILSNALIIIKIANLINYLYSFFIYYLSFCMSFCIGFNIYSVLYFPN